MLSLWPKHKPFCGPTAQITDPADLAIAEDKLLFLAQSELFPVEFKHLQSGIPLKSSCRIAGYSQFIGSVASFVQRNGFNANPKSVLKLSIPWT